MNRPRFSEETILSIAKTTLVNARTHETELNQYGITAAMLTQFDTDIQAAEALPDELQNRMVLRGYTQDKDGALDNCYLWGRQLRVRLETAFGKKSPEVKSFPSRQFKSALGSEKGMMPVLETLLLLADTYKETLANFGQTDAVLAQGAQCLTDLRAKDATQEVKKDEKRKATLERHQTFQGLYDTVNKINRVGRLVFTGNAVNLTLFTTKWPRSLSRVTVVQESEVPAPAEQPLAGEEG